MVIWSLIKITKPLYDNIIQNIFNHSTVVWGHQKLSVENRMSKLSKKNIVQFMLTRWIDTIQSPCGNPSAGPLLLRPVYYVYVVYAITNSQGYGCKDLELYHCNFFVFLYFQNASSMNHPTFNKGPNYSGVLCLTSWPNSPCLLC